jgi:hypothetical protein
VRTYPLKKKEEKRGKIKGEKGDLSSISNLGLCSYL